MNCKTNKDLFRSKHVKELFEKIIDDTPIHYASFVKKGLLVILAKLNNGKDFDDEEKTTLIEFSKSLDLEKYIAQDILKTLESPYIKKEEDIYRFDADKIIENQEKSKTILDSDYIKDLLFSYPNLGEVSQKRLQYVSDMLSFFGHDDTSGLYQEEIQIKENKLYIRGVIFPEEQTSSYDMTNKGIQYHTHQIHTVLGFVAKLMKIELKIPEEFGKDKETFEELSEQIFTLQKKIKIKSEDEALGEQLKNAKKDYKNKIRNLSQTFVEQHTHKEKMVDDIIQESSILQVLKDLIGYECKIPYQPGYNDQIVCINLHRYPNFSLLDNCNNNFREYYQFN